MIYRKRGVTDRWENGTLLHVNESGVAIEGEVFECYPEERSPDRRFMAGRPSRSLPMVAREIEKTIPSGVSIERLILMQGIVEHEYEERSWCEETFRLHLSLSRNRTRALLDLAAMDLGSIAAIAQSLLRLTGERPAPPRVRLAPNVTAALLPSLIGLAPPNVRLIQTAGGIDGKGHPIEEAHADWPNWYRPSYRVRPMRMPLNLRIECDVAEIETPSPLAVALLAPVDGLSIRVLVDDGDEAWPASVRVTRIDAVSPQRIWYPYGGGSFGAEMML